MLPYLLKLLYHYNYIYTVGVPSSLNQTIFLNGVTVSGQITSSNLLDIIKLGQIPTFSVSCGYNYKL